MSHGVRDSVRNFLIRQRLTTWKGVRRTLSWLMFDLSSRFRRKMTVFIPKAHLHHMVRPAISHQRITWTRNPCDPYSASVLRSSKDQNWIHVLQVPEKV